MCEPTYKIIVNGILADRKHSPEEVAALVDIIVRVYADAPENLEIKVIREVDHEDGIR